MDTKELMNKIGEDLEARELLVAGVLTVDIDGQLQLITYDQRGLVSDISQPVPVLSIYSREDPKTNAMREVTTISGIKKKEPV